LTKNLQQSRIRNEEETWKEQSLFLQVAAKKRTQTIVAIVFARWHQCALHLVVLLAQASLPLRNGISISSVVLPSSPVCPTNAQTDSHTHHANKGVAIAVAIGRIGGKTMVCVFFSKSHIKTQPEDRT